MASETTIDPLLATKLHRPAVGELHVHRPGLLERLDQSPWAGGRESPGFGYTPAAVDIEIGEIGVMKTHL